MYEATASRTYALLGRGLPPCPRHLSLRWGVSDIKQWRSPAQAWDPSACVWGSSGRQRLRQSSCRSAVGHIGCFLKQTPSLSGGKGQPSRSVTLSMSLEVSPRLQRPQVGLKAHADCRTANKAGQVCGHKCTRRQMCMPRYALTECQEEVGGQWQTGSAP